MSAKWNYFTSDNSLNNINMHPLVLLLQSVDWTTLFFSLRVDFNPNGLIIILTPISPIIIEVHIYSSTYSKFPAITPDEGTEKANKCGKQYMDASEVVF